MKVCLDPGHGGKDPGASGFGLLEKNLTLEVSQKIANILRSNGVEVILSRTADITLDPEARIKVINDINADIVVSVHYNSLNSSVRGFEVIYSKFKKDNSQKLASLIFNSLKSLALPARRIYTRENSTGDSDYYFMIRRILATSVIVESAFIDNSEDNKLLQTTEFRNRNAEAIARGILEYRNQFFAGKEQPVSDEPTAWAKDAINNMKKLGIMVGDSNNKFNPQNYVTREELAVVADRIIKHLSAGKIESENGDYTD